MRDGPLMQTLGRLEQVVEEMKKILKDLKRYDSDTIVIQADEKLPECAPFLEDPSPHFDPLGLGCRFRPGELGGEEPPIRVSDYTRLCEKLLAWIDGVAEITRKHADPEEPSDDQE